MTTVQIESIEDSPFYVHPATWDDQAFEFYAVDASCVRHWADRAWDAEKLAMAANAEIRIGNMSEADLADERQLYDDLRGGM